MEDENEEKSGDKEQRDDKEESDDKGKTGDKGKSGDKERNVEAQATGTSANRSEYSRIREANIAENKRILSELGLLSGLVDKKDKTKKGGKKGKKEHEANPTTW